MHRYRQAMDGPGPRPGAPRNRCDRLAQEGRDGTKCEDGQAHNWQPLSFVFETQLLDDNGRVIVRQPDETSAKVYVVCVGCNSYSYITVEWVGYRLGGPGQPDRNVVAPKAVRS